MKKAVAVLTLVAILSLSAIAFAHSGGTNSQGRHTNHKTGDYHCHNPRNK